MRTHLVLLCGREKQSVPRKGCKSLVVQSLFCTIVRIIQFQTEYFTGFSIHNVSWKLSIVIIDVFLLVQIIVQYDSSIDEILVCQAAW